MTGTAVLVGLVASASSFAGGASPAVAAPNGGACAPNNRFGAMIPNLPAADFPNADLVNVGNFITETNHVQNVFGTEDPDQDESDIDAGYTYVGQFIDHDITLDPRPNDLITKINPATLINNRTPQFDLDSVYGRGPAASPELYEADGVMLKLGARQTGAASDPEARDILRGANGRGVLGDGRNDENKIVASFHSIMTRFHNKVARDVKAARPTASNQQVFEEARRQVQWYYQWATLTDFLPTMSSAGTVAKTAWYDGTRWQTNLKWYDSCKGSMPLEFSTAAYRWHTMVRDDYIVNDQINDLEIFDGTFNPRSNLAGGQPAPSDFAFDWDFYFKGGARTPQEAYKFDNSLVPSLGILPAGAAGAGPTNLSIRNLQRGSQLGLPSGQDVARALGVPVLRDDQIIVGPALAPGAQTKALTEFSASFKGKAPLWAYLAAESVNAKFTVSGGRIIAGDTKALRLGPLGAAIVNETMVGLMANDPNSVINNPGFKPDPAYMRNGQFKFSDLIRIGTTRTDTPTPVCTTVNPVKTIWNWWYFRSLKPVTTCTTPTYPNPKTVKTYTIGTAPAPTANLTTDKSWVVGTDSGAYRWDGSTWVKKGDYVKEISVAADGTALAINTADNSILKYNGASTWSKVGNGAGFDIAVVKNNVYFAIGTDNNVYRWNGSTWLKVGHNARSISAASDGTVLITNRVDNSIWRYVADNNWTLVPGKGAALDIAVVKNNVYFAIGTDSHVWRYTGSSWVKVGVDASSIGAAADGTVLVSNRYNNSIWRYNADNNWTALPGFALDVTVR